MPSSSVPAPYPTLTAYQPTLRDRAATGLLGLLGGGALARQFTSGLLGSTGLGASRAGLLDYTPAGLAFQADEAGRSIANGHPVSGGAGLLAAAVPLPVAASAAKEALRPVERAAVKEVAAPIRAYHGSPHTFDEFSLDKIGTGEGAQAFGHGLYFAENEGVARSYRDALRPPGMRMTGPDGTSVVAMPHSPDLYEPLVSAMSGIDAPRYLKTAVAKAHASGDSDLVGTAYRTAFGLKHLPDAERLDARAQIARIVDQARPVLDRYKVDLPGSMYEVGLHADPESLLNWDAPLMQQGRAREALAPHGATGLAAQDSAGVAFRQVQDRIGPERAARVLKDGGVSGVRYLDNGSRGGGSGTSNFVIFDPKIIELRRRYGIGGLLAGGAAYGAVSSPKRR